MRPPESSMDLRRRRHQLGEPSSGSPNPSPFWRAQGGLCHPGARSLAPSAKSRRSRSARTGAGWGNISGNICLGPALTRPSGRATSRPPKVSLPKSEAGQRRRDAVRAGNGAQSRARPPLVSALPPLMGGTLGAVSGARAGERRSNGAGLPLKRL